MVARAFFSIDFLSLHCLCAPLHSTPSSLVHSSPPPPRFLSHRHVISAMYRMYPLILGSCFSIATRLFCFFSHCSRLGWSMQWREREIPSRFHMRSTFSQCHAFGAKALHKIFTIRTANFINDAHVALSIEIPLLFAYSLCKISASPSCRAPLAPPNSAQQHHQMPLAIATTLGVSCSCHAESTIHSSWQH